MSFVFAECVPHGQPFTPVDDCINTLEFLNGLHVRGTFTRAYVTAKIKGVDLHVWLMKDDFIHDDDFHVILNMGLDMDTFLAEVKRLAEQQESNVVELSPKPLHPQVSAMIFLRDCYGGKVNRVYTCDNTPHLTVVSFPGMAEKVRKEFADGVRAKMKSV